MIHVTPIFHFTPFCQLMVPQGYNIMPAHLCIVVEPRRKSLFSNVFISYSFSFFLSYISVIISIHCLFYMGWKFYHQKLLPEDVTMLSIMDVIHLEAYYHVYFQYQGLRPVLPEYMHPRLLDLMQRCWEAAPAKRPTFSDIRVELEELLQLIQVH